VVISSRLSECVSLHFLFNIISYSFIELAAAAAAEVETEKEFNEFPQTIFHNIFPHCASVLMILAPNTPYFLVVVFSRFVLYDDDKKSSL
jgi:hypothetical protein